MTKCFIRVILYKRYGTLCGSLAQLGEHLPYKQRVRGSSPLAPTKNGLVHRSKAFFIANVIVMRRVMPFNIIEFNLGGIA